jgi:hypothetical protein
MWIWYINSCIICPVRQLSVIRQSDSPFRHQGRNREDVCQGADCGSKKGDCCRGEPPVSIRGFNQQLNITIQLEDTLLWQIIGLPSELQLPNRENGIGLLQCIVLTSAAGPRASSAIAIAVSIAFRIVRHNRYCATVCILSSFHAKRRCIRFASVRIRTRDIFVGCSGGLFLFYSMFSSTADHF